MLRVVDCLTNDHDWRLVALAGVVCFLASSAAISLVARARQAHGPAQTIWLLTAGASTGIGIWATHFIGMLAYDPKLPVGFAFAPTILSLLVAIVVTTLGLGLAVRIRAAWAAPAGGALVGLGVACMHYLGMSALQLPAYLVWRRDLVALSILLGIVFAIAATTIAMRRERIGPLLLSSLLLTLAIVSHHFIGVAAAVLIPFPAVVVVPFDLSPGLLATGIAAAAIAVLGMCLSGAFADYRMSAQARRHDAEIKKQHELLEAAIENMSQGLCMFDADARLVMWNQRYIAMYQFPEGSVKAGASLYDLLRKRAAVGTYSGDPERYIDTLREQVASGKIFNRRWELADGRVIVVVNHPVPGGGWVATHEDITEQQQAEERIAYLAHHDILTGLPNRAAFAEHLASLLAQAWTEGDQVAVCCIDLDRFKEVNDVFGHSAGDALLREVGDRLRGAADGAYVARLGGDEFTIIARGPQPAAADATAGRLHAAIANEIEIEGARLKIGLSMGIAIYPNDGVDAGTLLANADAALYRAKADGRGTTRFFEADMDLRLRERRALQHDLRNAIANNELAIHFQPQATIGGEIMGFEALLRWHHPVRGLVPPATFIPLAEENGLIIPISEWVLREACREAATWARPLSVAVNLSPVQFQHGDLPAVVHAALLETGLPPHRLELEITEGVLIGDFQRALSILRRLKTLGVRIAMDDFGTGYSSLSYLQAFPFDKIKIDHSFISNLEKHPQSAAIVRAVIGLARVLKLPVLAEGVETQQQLAFLASEGCTEVQGYFIGRPRAIRDYAEMVGKSAVTSLQTAVA